MTLTGEMITAAADELGGDEELAARVLAAVAAEIRELADTAYGEDLFRRPSKQDYAEINALLKEHRGHQLDGVAADAMHRALSMVAEFMENGKTSW